MRHGLLNPTVEASVCRKMIDEAEAQLRSLEGELVIVTLPHEVYLEKIGAAKALRATISALQSIHDREFRV